MLANRKSTRLVRGFRVDDVAEACRGIAIDFVRGVKHGWGKEELATWLVGSYHPLSLLRFSRAELTAKPISGIFPSAKASGSVREPDVVKIMWEAREEVLGIIERFSHGDPSAESFLWRVQSLGALARIEDESGANGLVPNELAKQTLSDRVLSLIACDYVSHPLDYQDRAFVCRKCGSISFRENGREIGDCGEHSSGSGVRTRTELIEMDMDDHDVDDAEVMRMLARI